MGLDFFEGAGRPFPKERCFYKGSVIDFSSMAGKVFQNRPRKNYASDARN
jgi:hypothetical protein